MRGGCDRGLRSVSLFLGGVWRRCWLAFSAKRVVPLQCSDMTAMAGDDMNKKHLEHHGVVAGPSVLYARLAPVSSCLACYSFPFLPIQSQNTRCICVYLIRFLHKTW